MASVRTFIKAIVMVGVWLALMGAYAYIAWHRLYDRNSAIIIGLLGGTFAWMLFSTIFGFFTTGRDRAAIRRAANMEPRKDGRLEAVAGPIRALEKPLEAPFTGRPCVIYEYDVKPGLQGQSDYAGFAMAPCAVETLNGSAKVLGFVTLDQFPPAGEDQIDRERGKAYLASANFDSLGVLNVLSAFTSLVADDDGTIHKDFKIGGEGANLQGRRIVERSVPVGAPVTLIGCWSESRGGFTAGAGALTRLFNDDLARTRKRLGGDSVQMFFIALGFNAILHGILVPVFLWGGGHEAEARRHDAASVWDERDCDAQKAKLAGGADPNEVGDIAMTALMNAARQSETACVTNLIAAGARLEAHDKWGDTALVYAVTNERDDNAAALLKAGAKEFRVTAATGRPITPGAAPLAAVQAYIDAVHRGDFETMAHLTAHTSARQMEDHKEDLPGWQSIRPKTFTVDEGWMTDTAATLTIRGQTPSAMQRVGYHLEWQAESGAAEKTGAGFWQIRKEWFLVR